MDVIYNIPYISNKRGRPSIDDHLLTKLRCYQYNGHESICTSDPLVSCKFASVLNNRHILACSSEIGNILVQNTLGEKITSHVTKVCSNALFTLSWADDEMKLITGGGDHKMYLLNVTPHGNATTQTFFSGATKSFISSCFKPQSSDIFAAGSRDGSIIVWDVRNHCKNKPDIQINTTHVAYPRGPKRTCSVTSTLYVDEYRILSTSFNDKCIRVWDTRKSYTTSMSVYPEYTLDFYKELIGSSCGFISAAFNNSQTKMYAASTNGFIFCIDTVNYKIIPGIRYKGKRPNHVFSNCVVSPDNKYLACSFSFNHEIYIWKLNSSTSPMIILNMKEEAPCGIDWSHDNDIKIAVCTDAATPYIWTPSNILDSEFELDDMCAVQSNLCNEEPSACNKTSTKLVYQQSKQTPDDKTKFFALLKTLPNRTVDGYYEHHTCKRDIPRKDGRNWLTASCSKCKKMMKMGNKNDFSNSSEESTSMCRSGRPRIRRERKRRRYN